VNIKDLYTYEYIKIDLGYVNVKVTTCEDKIRIRLPNNQVMFFTQLSELKTFSDGYILGTRRVNKTKN
jgi:predicted ribosome-associated RNA-binding protein Tma20